MINSARVESDIRSARSTPSALSGDLLLLGSEQEITEEEPWNMMDIDVFVDPRINELRLENGSDREAYKEEQDSR